MSSSLRSRFGIPGVIAVFALVFAMVGGAYAAKKYVITSTSQIKPSVLKSLKGPAGPAGPAGSAGSAGAKGDTGPAGSNGNPGVAGATGATGVTGQDGSPWTADGTLPNGATETGTWGEGNKGVSTTRYYPISFSVPLADAPTPIFVGVGQTKAGCPGLDEGMPTANEGKLCVYAQVFEASNFVNIYTPVYDDFFEEWGLEPGASKTGALINISCSATFCASVGTWAVTGE